MVSITDDDEHFEGLLRTQLRRNERLSFADVVDPQPLFEALGQTVNRIRNNDPITVPCDELNPDIIVISNDHTLLFEAQNRRAAELLYRRCGLELEDVCDRERVRVHPCESGKIIAALKDAGLKVAA